MKLKTFSLFLYYSSIFLSTVALSGCAVNASTPDSYEVVYAVSDMPKGTVIKPKMLTERWLPACKIPSDAAIGVASCVGHQVKENISTGQIVGQFDVDSYYLPATQAVSTDAIGRSTKAEAQLHPNSLGLVVITRSIIPAGTILKKSDLEEKEISVERIFQDAMSDSSLCTERICKKTLARNQQLCQHDFQPILLNSRMDYKE